MRNSNNFECNKVWTLVEKPKDCQNVIGTKWIFKNKQDANGIVIRNKARLVAQGFSQVEGDANYAKDSLKWILSRNKVGRCKLCKGLSSLRRCDQVTRLKAPLDSAAIYPITPSLNKHLETGKRET
jgi:hypothetical protein